MKEFHRLALGLVCVLACTSIAATENATFCWGKGSNWQLGNRKKDNSSVPVQVADSQSFASVCTGIGHSCALEPSGKAWCWGDGERGQLGTGGALSSLTPVAVEGSHTFRSIACGSYHTCGLDDQNSAWCWGLNESKELGTEDRADSSVPVETAPGKAFVALSASEWNTCGLDSAGRAVCWGNLNETLQPAGGQTYAIITFSPNHACALEPPPSSKAWCWARFAEAERPNGFVATIVSIPNSEAVPVPVPGSRTFTAISTGGNRTCAIDSGGSLWCWEVRLLKGQYTKQFTPLQVGKGRSFVAVSAAWEHTCALDDSGAVMCFGGNKYGELGNGMFNSSSAAPTTVAGGHRFFSLGPAAGQHTCAIATRAATGSAPPSPSPSPSPSRSPSPSPGTSSSPAPAPAAAAPPQSQEAATSPSRSSSPPPSSPLSPSLVPQTSATNASTAGSGSSSTSSSSSVPIGAIAGGVTAGAAVLAVLAFFAWRPHKGWLRQKPAVVTLEDGSNSKLDAAIDGGQGSDKSDWPTNASPSQGPPPQPLAAASDAGGSGQLDTLLFGNRLPTGSIEGPDTLLPYSAAPSSVPNADEPPVAPVLLPSEQLPVDSTAGWPSPSLLPGPPLPPSNISGAGLEAAAAAAPSQPSSHTSSTVAPAGDSILSFISSRLASRTAVHSHLQPAALGADGRSPSGSGSGGLELRTDARLWEVQWEELSIQRLLGRGSFGSVYLAVWSHTRVAVKVLIGKDHVDHGQLQLPEKVLQDLQAEAAVMSRMRHPNIVQYMGLVALPPALITEYCSRGSLYDCLAAARKQAAAAAQLTWRRRLAMAADAGTGLCYLHRRGIIHRDVKSPNLLVDEAWRVKVADFNLSKILVGARPESSITAAGLTNPIWAAPEVLEGGRATPASDVYSFGMVLYELLTWRLPWSFVDMSPFKVGATIMAGGRPEVPPGEALAGPDTAAWSGLDAYLQLMRECWAQRPEERPSFDEVVGRLRQLLDGAPPSPA